MSQRFGRVEKPGFLLLSTAGLFLLSSCVSSKVCSPGDTSPGCFTPCVPGDTRPQCQSGGQLVFNWTVNGQPASTGCTAAGAATVRFVVGGAPAVAESCATGTRTFAGLAAGPVQVVVDLLDGNGTTMSTFNNSVTVVAGQPTTVQIAFTTNVTQAGSVAFTWTVGGQPASSACPAGTQVTFEATTAPATPPSPLTVACTQGAAQLDNLPVGNYVFKATLSSPTPVVVENIAVTVLQSQVANVPPIDFAAASAPTGSATVKWTINGGYNNCPAGATTTVVITAGMASPPTLNPVDCAQGQTGVQIPNLPAGPGYTFEVTVTDPAHTDQPQKGSQTVEIAAGNDALITVDIACCFCPSGAGC
jgi:hypothetical protein